MTAQGFRPGLFVETPPAAPPPPPPAVNAVTFIVPTGSVLPTINDALYPNLTRARIVSLLDDADLIKTSTLTVDNITVWATLSGTGRWVRRNQPSLAWQLQADWGINPATGNDENVGTAASPLASPEELQRRLTQWGSVPNGTVIQVLSDLNIDRPLRLQLTLPPPPNGASATRLCIKGTSTVLASGTLTGYTPLSRAGLGARNAITSAVDFTSHVNRKIRLTSGPGAGYYAFIQVGAAGSASITPWAQAFTSDTLQPPGAAVLQPAGIGAGDAFEIVELASIGAAPQISLRGGGGANGTNNQTSGVQIKDVRDVQVFASAAAIPTGYIEAQSPGIGIWELGCDLGHVSVNVGLQRVQGCIVGGGVMMGVSVVGNSARFTGGGTRVDGSAGLAISGGGTVGFDGDFAFTIPLIIGGGSTIMSCFQAACRLGNVAFFVTGDALQINDNGFVQARNGEYGGHAVYGTATTYGIRANSHAGMTYVSTKPTINTGLGVGRETIIGGVDTLYAAVPSVNPLNLAMIVVAA
ncbi:MAG TPA: hypothetical protein VJN18_11250 [Polyangiaceae bacterium]|nr:hypothetical protein [Polyangiaceae bacterium]